MSTKNNKTISVKFSNEELELMDSIYKKAGLKSRSEYIRYCVFTKVQPVFFEGGQEIIKLLTDVLNIYQDKYYSDDSDEHTEKCMELLSECYDRLESIASKTTNFNAPEAVNIYENTEEKNNGNI